MRPLWVCAVVVVAFASMACDESRSPLTPSPPPPVGPPAPPDSLRVTSLIIGGPDTVAPGQQVQLTATAQLTDGSSRNVTDEVEWGGGNEIVSVSSTGLVSAGAQRGLGHITARYTRLQSVHGHPAFAVREQYVLPPGTYLLYGSVSDEGVYLNGVRVEITAGSAAGMSVTANGFFRFYGVEGDTEIRVSKDGYETEARRVQVTGHHTEEFRLRLSQARPTVAGEYQLRIEAAGECRANLPTELQSRSYRAVLTQTGPNIRATLGGAKFPNDPLLGAGNNFPGTVEPHQTTFTLYGYYDDFGMGVSPPSVLEVIDAPMYLTFYGRVTVTPTAQGYSGAFDGVVALLRILSVYDYQLQSYCESSRHTFTLIR